MMFWGGPAAGCGVGEVRLRGKFLEKNMEFLEMQKQYLVK